MDFNDVINKRYSVRKFSDDEVSEGLTQEILEAGRIAPSAGNNQPTIVYVLKEKHIKLLNSYPELKLHPVVSRTKQALLVCYDNDKAMRRPHDNFSFGIVDSSIVTTYMMLKIAELGLGSVWVGWFNSDKIKEALKLPSNIEISAILPFGYISNESKASKLHRERKSMEEFKRSLT